MSNHRYPFLFACSLGLALIATPIGAQGGGDLYGDLYVIERDGNGEPILDAMDCEQPIAADCAFVPLWWWNHPPPAQSPGARLEDDEEEPCDVDLELAEQLGALPREVVLGRLSVTRAPGRVLEHSYTEAISKINSAEDLRADAAGRLELRVLTDRDHDGVPDFWTWATIDSPLENLALYKTLLTEGCLLDLTPETQALLIARGFGFLVGTPPEQPDELDLLQAASFLAAAADKAGRVSLDTIIQVHTFAGINTVLDGQVVEYFDFGDFAYDRSIVYPSELRALLLGFAPRCEVSRLCFAPALRSIGDEVGFLSAQVCRGGIDVTGDWPQYGGANWFAEAVDHTREVVWFLHNWAIPD